MEPVKRSGSSWGQKWSGTSSKLASGRAFDEGGGIGGK